MLRYLKGAQDYGIHYTRDITRLGLRNQKLNTLYALSEIQTLILQGVVRQLGQLQEV